MRNRHLNFVLAIAVISLIAYGLNAPAWSEETKWSEEGVVTKEGKKYPHPHILHLEAISQRTADFSGNEIIDWPNFLGSLNDKIQILSFSAGAKMAISGLKPQALSGDEKTIVVNEMNKLLVNENLPSLLRDIVTFSRDTGKFESEYSKTKSKEDLKWLNRSIINDMFPQTTRIGKVKELRRMTCTTCHEAYAPKEELKEAGIEEKTVMECFSKAIAGERGMEECIEKAKILRESKIQPYGPLKLFVQRNNTEGYVPLLVAVHPEEPYTFKPLLKRLVCVECHSRERKVDKVMGRDGKVKEISLFYGAGSEKRLIHKPE
jgi:hypothetical protein